YLKLGTLDKVPLISRLDGRSTFEAMLNGLGALADRVERLVTTRRLQPQLFLMVALTVIVGFAPFYGSPIQWGFKPLTPIDPAFAVLWAVGVACAIGAAWQAKYHRLAALMLMGGSGFVACITFVWFSAPDL